jgi:hypothetical protein
VSDQLVSTLTPSGWLVIALPPVVGHGLPPVSGQRLPTWGRLVSALPPGVGVRVPVSDQLFSTLTPSGWLVIALPPVVGHGLPPVSGQRKSRYCGYVVVVKLL